MPSGRAFLNAVQPQARILVSREVMEDLGLVPMPPRPPLTRRQHWARRRQEISDRVHNLRHRLCCGGECGDWED